MSPSLRLFSPPQGFVKIIQHIAVRFNPAAATSMARFDAVQRNGIAAFFRRK
jgi:hypothetical protein